MSVASFAPVAIARRRPSPVPPDEVAETSQAAAGNNCRMAASVCG
jgi:hypothetical protein